MHIVLATLCAGITGTPKHTIYPKRIGKKVRIIYEPNEAMRIVQGRIITFLSEFAPPFTSSSSRSGGRGAVRNARRHIEGRYVFKIDIKNAFPSTEIRRLIPVIAAGVKRKFADAPTEDEWWEFFSKYVVSREGRLPHGARTSSFLFEWYCERFIDMPLRLLCAEWKAHVVYTRYVDDLVFTSDMPLSKKGKRSLIRAVIARAGFEENFKKTVSAKLAQKSISITGPCVGGESRIGVPRTWLKESEAVLYSALAREPEVKSSEIIHGRIRYLLDVIRGKRLLTSLEEKVLGQYLKYCLMYGIDVGWVHSTLKRKGAARFL
jgi:hypothetical protein